jgi:hypothetical protein
LLALGKMGGSAMLKKVVLVSMLLICLGAFSGCGNEKSASTTPKNDIVTLGKVDINFDYVKQQGMGSNQFAVWIEDAKGNYIKTLGVTKFVATKGYKTREMALLNWVKLAKRSEMNNKEVEAITKATPNTGGQIYVWDCTDANGKAVVAGEYRYVVEACRYMEDYDLFSGKVAVGKNTVTSKAEMKTVGDALKNKSMITNVTAKFVPTDKL